MSAAPVWPSPGVFTAPPWVMPPLMGATSRAAVAQLQWAHNAWAAPPPWGPSWPGHALPVDDVTASLGDEWGADADVEEEAEEGSGSEYELQLSDEWAARFAATELRREQRKLEARRTAKAEKAAQRRHARSADAHAPAAQVASAAQPVAGEGAVVMTSATE